MPKPIYKNDLYDLAKLLEKGYTISDSLKIIGNHQEIIKALANGESINQFLDLNSKKTFNQSLSFFIQVSPLSQAIISSYEYDTMKFNMKKDWLKEITYPIFLLLFALFVFFFFEIYIYPQLLIYIDSNQSYLVHHFIIFFIRGCSSIIFVLSCIVILFYFIYKRNLSIYHEILKKYLGHLFIIKEIFTYDFSLNFYILMKRGYSTKQTFDLLLKINKNQMFRINISYIINQLNSGYDILEIVEKHPYFDTKFKYFFKIGYYTQNIENTIYDYCTYQEKKFQKYLKTSSKIITIFSYLLICLLIISIYQLLLLPLETIQQF